MIPSLLPRTRVLRQSIASRRHSSGMRHKHIGSSTPPIRAKPLQLWLAPRGGSRMQGFGICSLATCSRWRVSTTWPLHTMYNISWNLISWIVVAGWITTLAARQSRRATGQGQGRQFTAGPDGSAESTSKINKWPRAEARQT